MFPTLWEKYSQQKKKSKRMHYSRIFVTCLSISRTLQWLIESPAKYVAILGKPEFHICYLCALSLGPHIKVLQHMFIHERALKCVGLFIQLQNHVFSNFYRKQQNSNTVRLYKIK